MGLYRFIGRFFTDRSQISLAAMIDQEFFAPGREKAARRAHAENQEHARREAIEAALNAARHQQRREAARAACEDLYLLHAPEIGERLSREVLADYVRRHMGDDRPAETVEARARQLQEIIRRHLERVEPPPKRMTIAELAEWFLREKRQIDAAPLSPEDREAILAQLEARYAKLQEKHIRSIEP
jgi:hypothetical protein